MVGFVGVRGTGASTLARGFAVAAADSLDVLLVDLDRRSRASLLWGQHRLALDLRPTVPVAEQPLSALDSYGRAADLLVFDIPSELAPEGVHIFSKMSLIIVSATSAARIESMQFMRQLIELGLGGRIVVAMCRVCDTDEATVARNQFMGRRCNAPPISSRPSAAAAGADVTEVHARRPPRCARR
jgi:hypothetical protein